MAAEVTAADVAAERARLVAAEARFPGGTVGELVEAVARYGERIAIDVFDRAERITYGELDRVTNGLGNALRAMGVAKGDRVAVMLPNRLAYPVLWLALAKIGAIHVPVNVRYTPREIAYVVADSGAATIVADAEFVPAVEAAGLEAPRRIVVGEAAGWTPFDTLAGDDAPARDPSVTPGDLLNIQYTSGTTGFPKGCMLSHEYWQVLSWSAAEWLAEPVSRYLTAQPFFYMDPQWHLLMALRTGGTLFMAPRLSATQYAAWVKAHRIEWAQFPLLATRQPASDDDGRTALKQVATFNWDGETCRAFRRRFGVLAREGFGMTEIGLGTLMPPAFEAMSDSTSVGIPGPFRETTIRDEAGRPMPPGADGELWVRGRGLFGGYWGKPEATAEAMRRAEDGGLPWFRTGDVFRADERGFLWIVGRIKDMIRRSGENIAAREVEAVLRELPEVEDAAAVPVPDPRRGEEVKVYLLLKPGTSLDPEAVLAHARTNLAPFKVPRYVAFVPALPRTASNKVEKRTLVAGVADLTLGSYDAEAGLWW